MPNSIESAATYATKQVDGIAEKPPEGHLEDSKAALVQLKNELSENFLNFERIDGLADALKVSLKADQKVLGVLNSAVQASQAVMVEWAGGFLRYEPNRGLYWQNLEEYRASLGNETESPSN